jgi:hypothetical protein
MDEQMNSNDWRVSQVAHKFKTVLHFKIAYLEFATFLESRWKEQYSYRDTK